MSPIGGPRSGIVGGGGGAAFEIPDSVLYQYDFIANFTQGDATVIDSAGSADMSLTGDPQNATIGGESGAESDGVDDYGQANGPEDIGQNETLGIAFTFLSSAIDDQDTYLGGGDGQSSLRVYTSDFDGGAVGNIRFGLIDESDNRIARETGTTTYDDGSAHAVVITKTGNTASDINVYVDDMANAADSNTLDDEAFDHTNYDNTADMAVWARNNNGTIDGYSPLTLGVVEFWGSAPTQSEREEFLSRRPEV